MLGGGSGPRLEAAVALQDVYRLPSPVVKVGRRGSHGMWQGFHDSEAWPYPSADRLKLRRCYVAGFANETVFESNDSVADFIGRFVEAGATDF